jgi:hypothetical protein
MTPAQRRKAKADAQRSKATYDLPEEIITAIREIAKQEDISQSDLVAELLVRAVNIYRAGELVLDKQKQPARSLKWLYKLDISPLDTGNSAILKMVLRWCVAQPQWTFFSLGEAKEPSFISKHLPQFGENGLLSYLGHIQMLDWVENPGWGGENLP